MAASQLWQGVEEFNQGKFYDCHDTLEALWMDAPESDKNFYQGILQIAVGCYHLENHNWRGAVTLLGEGTRRLREYEPVYAEVDITSLLADSIDLLIAVQQIPPAEIEQFALRLETSNVGSSPGLPKIKKVSNG